MKRPADVAKCHAGNDKWHACHVKVVTKVVCDRVVCDKVMCDRVVCDKLCVTKLHVTSCVCV